MSKRKDALFCSAKCRVTDKRKKVVTDKSVTDNVTDKLSVTPKDSWLCKIEGCNLPNMPGHGDMCIYHWRVSEKLYISKQQYDLLNKCS